MGVFNNLFGRKNKVNEVDQINNDVAQMASDFLFIAEEYKLQVGNSGFYIYLLFYYRGLQCIGEFELKAYKFKPNRTFYPMPNGHELLSLPPIGGRTPAFVFTLKHSIWPLRRIISKRWLGAWKR